MSRSYDVLLSHSGAQKDFVEELSKELTQQHGQYSVFFDRHSIGFGDDISTTIMEHAQTCKLQVAVLSDEYFTRSRPPMIELAARYTAAKAGNRGVPCLLPVFLALKPEHAKDSNFQKRWSKTWRDWKIDERMSERNRNNRPNTVQPAVWMEAVTKLLDIRGPVYIPEQYQKNKTVFMKEVAQIIAGRLDKLTGSVQLQKAPPLQTVARTEYGQSSYSPGAGLGPQQFSSTAFDVHHHYYAPSGNKCIAPPAIMNQTGEAPSPCRCQDSQRPV